MPEPIQKNELPHERAIGMEEIRKEAKGPEQEIAELEAQLARKRAELLVDREKKEVDLKKGEAALESIIEGQIPSAAPVLSVTPSPSAGATDEELSGEEKFRLNQLKRMDKESQLKFLIDIAFKKGIDEGIKLAKVLNNAYIIDEFHDKLIDEFYKKLVEGGILKEL